MSKSCRVQYFETEGREHLASVIKSVKAYLKALRKDGLIVPGKVVFLTTQGEGPMLAYTHLHTDEVKIIAVTFPATYAALSAAGAPYIPKIPEKVRHFFEGVGIPVITNRFPFDEISGAEAHNREMNLIKDCFAVLGGSIPLAMQAVLQAVDGGYVMAGEQVVVVTGDTALIVTAANSQSFLRRDESGLTINEIICKPSRLTRTKLSRIAEPVRDEDSIEIGLGTIDLSVTNSED